jgi:IclR family pca regulon transcriptional regulator
MASRSPAKSSASGHPPTNSLDRALALLELLRFRPNGLIHAELCRALGIPSSTCSYITARLEKNGYLVREPDSKRFGLGLKAVSLARTALLGLGFRSISEPVLYRVTAETGLSAGIGVQQGTHVLLVDHVDGPDVLNQVMGERTRKVRSRENREIGRELPFHATAIGKVLLAYMAMEELDRLIPKLKLSPGQAVTRSQLLLIRKKGFALSEGEYQLGIRALAVPIRDSTGTARAALSLNGRHDSPAWSDQPALIALAESAATEISRQSFA